MNYRNIALRELKDFADQFPTYTLGEILFSVLKTGNSANMPIKELLNLSDEQIYTMLEKAKEVEAE